MEIIREVFQSFAIYGDLMSAEPYGNGHINDTFKVEASQGGRRLNYIFQRMNREIFKDPIKLMDNIDRICTHQQRKLIAEEHESASRNAMTVIRSKTGDPFVIDRTGEYWRCYIFIEEALGYDIIETEKQAFQAARAFGLFQNLLSDLPGERLHESIPHFHNTPRRFEYFREVLEKDPYYLKAEVTDDIEFFLAFEDKVSYFTDLLASGQIPERVTHNDTKLNNVLLDTASGEAVCIIDLDTSMPGVAAFDFGDLVRTSTCFAAEDEADLSKVKFEKRMFEALLRGYLSSAADFLTETEVRSLVFGAILMTYEVGLRFLTDYLEGSVYFKSKYDKHNLVRCRTQRKLVEALMERQNELEELTMSVYSEIQMTQMKIGTCA